MTTKSVNIVPFMANLMPLYQGERHGTHWCARSLQDGTLIVPIDEDAHDEGWVRVHWQGRRKRTTEALGAGIATLALERYVRLHGTGAREEDIAAELWFMAEHFRHKTGCHAEFSLSKEPAHPAIRAAKRMGEGVLVNLLSKLAGG